jgi:ribulose-5-phosphate 4-epimerase/fuculose-1-phosphate aldolase
VAAETFAVAGAHPGPALALFLEALEDALADGGMRSTLDPHAAACVLNVVDTERPRPFRRHARGTFVASLHERPAVPADPLGAEYPLLVRSLANLVLLYVEDAGVWFTTLERGSFHVDARDRPLGAVAAEVAARLLPVARARLVIDNEFRTDLEPELWAGDALTEELSEAGRRLDALGLLPAPFPVEELLDERDLRHVKRLYAIGGLSYGNLSIRKDERRFWMSASGVDKACLDEPGRDILLVSDYDEEAGRIVLSVPPAVEPRRVSVDAIEHWRIYQQHPDVGAILHVHAWVDGIAATQIPFPCGSEELADAVASLVGEADDPAHAIVGLRNHGITATGEGLLEILDRIEPRVQRHVPMI